MNKEKIISIIIPVYNAEKYISSTIESVESQIKNSKEYEIIIVNDGSIDKSKAIIEQTINNNNYENIKIININNQGVSNARNCGIMNATGKYILFLDADDELINNSLEDLRDICKLNYDLILFNYEYYMNNKIKKNRIIFQDSSSEIEIKKLQNEVINGSNLNSVWQFCISRKYLEKNNIHFDKNIRVGEDLLFNLELFSHKPKLYYLNDILYRYKFNAGSVMNNNSIARIEKRLNDSINVYTKMYEYIKLWNCNNSINRNYIAIKYFNLLKYEFDKVILLDESFKKKINFIKNINLKQTTNISRKNIKIKSIIFKDILFLVLKLNYLYYFNRMIKMKIKKFLRGIKNEK